MSCCYTSAAGTDLGTLPPGSRNLRDARSFIDSGGCAVPLVRENAMIATVVNQDGCQTDDELR